MGLRLLKVNESIKETLSSVITSAGLKDPRIGFVTVTGVETTPDLRHAKVFVSVLGGQTERDLTMKALEKSRGFLQAKINASLHMKRTPQLQFFYDDTLDNALRIERALKREAEVLGAEPHEILVPGEDPRRARTRRTPGRDRDERTLARTRREAARRRPRRAVPAHARRAPRRARRPREAGCRRARRGGRHARPLRAARRHGGPVRLGGRAPALGDVLLPAGRVRRGAPPADAALYALDSGNPDRLALPSWGDVAVNIDHHHDNPRYGELAFVRGAASSTSELVCDIARALGLRLSPRTAAALYAGISFDTGHFHHDSTAPSTFRTAAWLVELESTSPACTRCSTRAARRRRCGSGHARSPGPGRRRRARAARLRHQGRLRRSPARSRGDRRHRRQPARRRRRRGRRPRQGTDGRRRRACQPALGDHRRQRRRRPAGWRRPQARCGILQRR